MSGDNRRPDTSTAAATATVEERQTNTHKTSFSVNAKPFIFKTQVRSTPNQPINVGNLFNTQNSLVNSSNYQQLRQMQLLNHPLNQLLVNNPAILNNIGLDKTRLPQQGFSQPNFNINDIITLVALSNLASNFLSCLPSSLQQFYSQLNTANQNSQKNHETPVTAVVEDVQQKKESDQSAIESNPVLLRTPKSKYPLEFEWSFWFFKNNRDSEWKDNIILLTTVDNVEDFWSVYNHLRPVTDLHEGCDYMFFKKGIQPMWEDEQNRDGGRWLISFDREQRQTCLANHWQNTLLSLVGSQYDKEYDLINGAVVNVRYKVDKLSLWTKHYTEEKAQYKIGKRFKRILNVTDGLLIYEIHDTNHQPMPNIEINAAKQD